MHANMQVQGQLFCTGLKYCEFIVYTNEDIHVERIRADSNFLDDKLSKAKHFFDDSILPELPGWWFSQPPDDAPSTSPSMGPRKQMKPNSVIVRKVNMDKWLDVTTVITLTSGFIWIV